MARILIIKTGTTVELARELGDFEDWIIACMQRSTDRFVVAEVFRGDTLPDYDEVSGVVVTGSPAMVTDRLDWSEAAARYLAGIVETDIPVLGICYGHQLLAHALGGRVDYHPRGREIGTVPVRFNDNAAADPLFGGVDRVFDANVSHSQSVIQLPADAVLLGANDFEAFHAVRFGECAWGVQFHPEFNREVTRRYIQQRREDLEKEGLDPERLLENTKETPQSAKLLADFAALIDVGVVSQQG